MRGSDDPDRIGTHKEADLKRVECIENDIQKIITCFKSGLMKDPFAEVSDSLSNIATGAVLPADEAEWLLASEEKGKAQMNSFIKQRLKTNTVSFWDAIPNLKINTFSSMTKKTTIKSTNLKLVTLTEDRDLFGRLMIVANVRQVNVKEILCYGLSTAPYALVHTDGTLRKTTKSLLLHILEIYVTVEPRLAPHPVHANSSNFRCYGTSAKPKICWSNDLRRNETKYFELITAHYQQRCHGLDVVFDHYWQLSIKAGEWQKRGEASTLEVRIHGESTPVPKQFPKYIRGLD